MQAGQFVAGSSAVPVTLIELTLSCRNLANMDTFSKSDPFVVVSTAPFGCRPTDNRWHELQRTETIMDSLNPSFVTKISVAYHFEELQYLKFDVYDRDSDSTTNLTAHDFLGTCSCSVAQLMASGGRRHQLPLSQCPRGGDGAQLLVVAEEAAACKQRVELTLSGRRLEKRGWLWTRCDPYFELYRASETAGWLLVYRSEHVRSSSQPDWRAFCVPLTALCGGFGDRHSVVRLVCRHWSNSDNDADQSLLIGECSFTLDQLERAALDPAPGGDLCQLDCVHPQKQKQKGSSYRNSGTIAVRQFRIQQTFTFLDYIAAGTQLACTIAIDFTASNGDPRSPESLHYMARDRVTGALTNPYTTALRAIGEIVEQYDSDRAFPVLGFGARLPPAGLVSHEFYVNMSADDPFCYRVEGVLQAYERCLPQIQLFGPTNFAPVVRHVADFAARYRDGSQYFILLIITDGVITDMQQTKQAIVDASSLPLSIIIVGVGEADFSAMEELDGDNERLSAGGRRAQRDIVQFVAFNKFTSGSGGSGGGGGAVRTRLAREVLAEVPGQFIGYMTANDIRPVPGAAPAGATKHELPPDPDLL